uniref:Uncharacterized protein n=1 Tax=Steinernema glaseri TaxID=37863 RepID=A0A1I7ZBJ2_9BILA
MIPHTHGHSSKQIRFASQPKVRIRTPIIQKVYAQIIRLTVSIFSPSRHPGTAAFYGNTNRLFVDRDDMPHDVPRLVAIGAPNPRAKESAVPVRYFVVHFGSSYLMRRQAFVFLNGTWRRLWRLVTSVIPDLWHREDDVKAQKKSLFRRVHPTDDRSSSGAFTPPKVRLEY